MGAFVNASYGNAATHDLRVSIHLFVISHNHGILSFLNRRLLEQLYDRLCFRKRFVVRQEHLVLALQVNEKFQTHKTTQMFDCSVTPKDN